MIGKTKAGADDEGLDIGEMLSWRRVCRKALRAVVEGIIVAIYLSMGASPTLPKTKSPGRARCDRRLEVWLDKEIGRAHV